MPQNKNKTALTTIGIDHSTNRQIDKLCKRYNLKKGEIVKLAFEYMDKACINPSETSNSISGQNALSSLFSILPTAADVTNPNPEDEQPLRKQKKKKKGKRIG